MNEFSLTELQQIESDESVTFSLNEFGRISASGPKAGVDRALARIVLFRGEVAQLLRERQGLLAAGAEIVTREVSPNVPSLDVQRANYIRWFTMRGVYFTPSADELDRMFAACNEGDEIIFDFAHSFTVRKPNGLLVSVDRKGRVSQPSPYTPALTQK